jgi:hypothetical protein
MSFWERFAKLLKDRNIPSKRLAKDSGVSLRYINAIRKGERPNPSVDKGPPGGGRTQRPRKEEEPPCGSPGRTGG